MKVKVMKNLNELSKKDLVKMIEEMNEKKEVGEIKKIKIEKFKKESKKRKENLIKEVDKKDGDIWEKRCSFLGIWFKGDKIGLEKWYGKGGNGRLFGLNDMCRKGNSWYLKGRGKKDVKGEKLKIWMEGIEKGKYKFEEREKDLKDIEKSLESEKDVEDLRIKGREEMILELISDREIECLGRNMEIWEDEIKEFGVYVGEDGELCYDGWEKGEDLSGDGDLGDNVGGENEIK